MSSTNVLLRSVLTLACLALPLRGDSNGQGMEFGGTMKFQRPLGEYRDEIVDAQFGFGLGLQAHFGLNPGHALSARIDYDWFLEGSSETAGQPYGVSVTTDLRELSLGLNYEWHYNGAPIGGYLLAGPVYRRWSENKKYTYVQSGPVAPGELPANYSTSHSPSRLGLNIGWGYRGHTGSAVEIHLVTSQFGDSGMSANTIQLSATHYF